MTEHEYLPTTIISDERSAFATHEIKKSSNFQAVTLEHATATCTGTTMLERTQASLRKALKAETNE